jgi:pyruvate, water dikinase
VMFTCNPVSGDPSIVAINASWGLGSTVVGGEVTPDEFLISKVTGEIVRRTVNRKEVEHRPAEGGGIVTLEVSGERAAAPCLDDERLRVLVEVARSVERHFGSHQDIEWALDHEGEAFVVQSRPVTATATPHHEAPKGKTALDMIMSRFGA